MHKVFIWRSGISKFEETREGSTDQIEAIIMAVKMCADDLALYQKSGRKAYMSAGKTDGKVVFTGVTSKYKIISRYAVSE